MAVLQLLLAGLHAWIILDLQISGTEIRPLALAFAATFVVAQLAVLLFAWTLQRNAHAVWILAHTYPAGLAILGLIVGLSEFANFDVSQLMVQPGAVLPPMKSWGVAGRWRWR